MKQGILWLIGIMLVTGCATVMAPKGGPRDEEPPKIVKEKSTENFQTNYKPELIELTFDEWVKLEDVRNQVVISPPLGTQDYEVKLRGKTVRVQFDEELEWRENATYTINFGEGVKDLNEGNPAEDLRFVFATGAILDSLKIEAKIQDAVTNEPVEDALVMLYENRADSVVRTERPYYFGKTNEEGVAIIENIRADTFKMAVLAGSISDYLFNQPEQEQVGFSDSMIVVTATPMDTIRLPVFKEKTQLKLNDSEVKTYGVVKLLFNHDPTYDLDTFFTDTDLNFIREQDKDTLKLWYTNPPEGEWNVYIRPDTSRTDTITVKPFQEVKVDSLRYIKGRFKLNNFNLTKAVQLRFNQPIVNWDTSLMQFTEDTLFTNINPEIAIDTFNPKILTINYKWKEGLPYQFTILPGAMTSVLEQTHDTISLKLKAGLLKQFGNINLTVSNLDSTAQYIIQITDKDKIIQSMIAKGVNTYAEQLKAVEPGQYDLKVITDLNRNGRWDTGNYDLKLQPEPIYIKKMEQLRANWDLEVIVEKGGRVRDE